MLRTDVMEAVATRTLVDRLSLAEGPVWDDRAAVLWFVDITERQVLRLAPDREILDRFTMPTEIGSLGLATDGRLVVALRTGVHLFDPASGRLDLLVHPEPHRATNRLNDGKVGPDGNFWVGSLDDRAVREPVGALYRVTPQGVSTCVVAGVHCSNGLAWSPDGRTMYHSDSSIGLVRAFDFDPSRGSATNPRDVITLDPAQGLPDGAAMDVDGCYWSAGVSAGILNRIDPGGAIVQRIALPVTAPTMPCFGGPDMRTVFVTSLASDRTGTHQPGRLISFRADIAGVPAWRFGEGLMQ